MSTSKIETTSDTRWNLCVTWGGRLLVCNPAMNAFVTLLPTRDIDACSLHAIPIQTSEHALSRSREPFHRLPSTSPVNELKTKENLFTLQLMQNSSPTIRARTLDFRLCLASSHKFFQFSVVSIILIKISLS